MIFQCGAVFFVYICLYIEPCKELICGVNSCNCGNADADFYEYRFDCARAGRACL